MENPLEKLFNSYAEWMGKDSPFFNVLRSLHEKPLEYPAEPNGVFNSNPEVIGVINNIRGLSKDKIITMEDGEHVITFKLSLAAKAALEKTGLLKEAGSSLSK